MQYFGCKTKQEYADKAMACLKGINKIRGLINNAESPQDKSRLAEQFAEDLIVLQQSFTICMLQCKPKYKWIMEE